MNVVGTNVRKLCAELMQDLLPEAELCSESVVTKSESADGESVPPEKQKTKNKDWDVTQLENEAGVPDKGHDTTTIVPESCDISMGHTAVQKEKAGTMCTSEIEPGRPVEVTRQWESSGKAHDFKFEGQTRLGERAVHPKVIGKEIGMVLERCKGKCAPHHESTSSS